MHEGPCLIQEDPLSIRRILIAVDDTPVSVRAADFGRELARSLGGEVALIHVNDNARDFVGDTGIPRGELIERAAEDARRLLAGFRERLALEPSALEFVEAGPPATTIARAAKHWPADLIVIGSRGRSGMRRALLGSVAEGVMRNAPCPVLVVRAPS
jgi:nucleotide-binding universal stress UspA family protein